MQHLVLYFLILCNFIIYDYNKLRQKAVFFWMIF